MLRETPELHRFSTSNLQAGARIGGWERHNARMLVPIQCRTSNGAPLRATELNLALPNVRVAHVSANAHTLEHTARVPAEGAADSLLLYFTLFGDATYDDAGGTRRQRPGTLLVCTSERPFRRSFDGGLREFAMAVPRSLVPGVVSRRARSFTFSAAPGADPDARALAALARSLITATDPAEPLSAERAAVELVSSLLAGERTSSPAARRHAAELHIRDHLADPGLSAGDIAAAVGLSERQLSRVFAATGCTIPETVRNARLDAARRLLRTGAPGLLRVREVAATCGFSSHAQFARAFRAQFGLTPQQFRDADTAGEHPRA